MPIHFHYKDESSFVLFCWKTETLRVPQYLLIIRILLGHIKFCWLQKTNIIENNKTVENFHLKSIRVHSIHKYVVIQISRSIIFDILIYQS